MKKRILLSFLLLAAPLAAVTVTAPTRWSILQTAVVNLDTAQASYTLHFYDGNGLPLALGIVDVGTVTFVHGVIPVNGSAVLQTAGGGSVRQGWAQLISSQKVGASHLQESRCGPAGF